MSDRGTSQRPHSSEDEVDLIIGEWAVQRPDMDATSIGVFGRLSRLLPLVRAATARLHREHGLSPAAFDVLAGLRRGGPPFRRTVGELAASSLLTSSAVTLRLDKLERDGLVRRVRTGADRRQVYAELTPQGRSRIDAIFEEHIALEQRMLESLGPRATAQLTTLLRELTASVRAVGADER